MASSSGRLPEGQSSPDHEMPTAKAKLEISLIPLKITTEAEVPREASHSLLKSANVLVAGSLIVVTPVITIGYTYHLIHHQALVLAGIQIALNTLFCLILLKKPKT